MRALKTLIGSTSIVAAIACSGGDARPTRASVPATEPGASPSGGSGSSPHEVSCAYADTTGPAYKPFCACEGLDSNSGDAAYHGHCAADANSPVAEFCCADSSYPAGTSSCSCYYSTRYLCFDDSGEPGVSNRCHCQFDGVDRTGTAPHCNSAPGRDGVPWTCCASASGECTCSEGSFSCTDGVEVSDCSTPEAAGYRAPPASCPAGTTVVDSCAGTSGGGTCSSTCSGCTGDGPICCFSCNNGQCEETCQ